MYKKCSTGLLLYQCISISTTRCIINPLVINYTFVIITLTQVVHHLKYSTDVSLTLRLVVQLVVRIIVIVCVCVFPQSVDSNSTPEELVQTHLEAVQMIREKAASASQKAAEDMKKHFSCKNPPAEYAIGSEVLVMRFSSNNRKTAGKKSSNKATRIVRGTRARLTQERTVRLRYAQLLSFCILRHAQAY